MFFRLGFLESIFYVLGGREMRLVTRADFDGLICGVLLSEAGITDSLKFVHPKDLQDGLFQATSDDVLANVPYVNGCGLWFDHHASEEDRVGWNSGVKGESRQADSAARIIYEYYGGDKKFPKFKDIIEAVDKVDAAKLSQDEIMNPKGWVLLGFICDPRTGLGRLKDFKISNFQLMEDLIEYCRKMSIDQILNIPDVKERIEVYFEQTELFVQMIKKHTKTDKNVIITDLRDVKTIYTGNRFIIYSMFPQQDVSVWIVDGKNGQVVSIACGYSILKRTCSVDIGRLMLKYGGGGHKAVGTCQVHAAEADVIIEEVIEELKRLNQD